MFFVENNSPSDDDAAFKERLKNMGKGMRIVMVNEMYYGYNKIRQFKFLNYKHKVHLFLIQLPEKNSFKLLGYSRVKRKRAQHAIY